MPITLAACTINTQNGIPFVVTSLQGQANLTVRDTTTTGELTYGQIYRTAPFALGRDVRNMRKRLLQVTVYGTGTFFDGLLYALYDNLNSIRYSILKGYSDPQNGIIARFMIEPYFTSRDVEVMIWYTGTDVAISEIEGQFTLID